MTSTIQHVEGGSVGRGRRVLVMAVLMIASAVFVIDLFVIGIALPHMQGTFSATPDEIAWVAIAFILGSTVMIIATGWISARIGAKRLFVISLACVMVVSVLCANAQTLEEEALWRFFMGMFGAPIYPLCQVFILNTYAREDHGQALATWGVGVMIAPVIGLPLGGLIIDLFGWPGVFYMILPLDGLALLGALAFLPRTESEPHQRLDLFGLLLLVVTFVLLQFVLSRGARLDWFESTEIVVALVVAAVCAYLFVVHLFTSRAPLFPPEIFRIRNFSFGMLGTFAFGIVNMMVIILLPLMLQNQLRYPVDLIGLILAPRAMGTLVGQYVVAVLVTRTDPRHLVTLGVLLSAGSTWIMSGWTLEVSPWQVTWPAVIHGISAGIIWTALNSMTISTLEPRLRQHGVPMYFLSFNVGFGFGVAAILTYWVNSAQANHAMLTEHVTPFNELMRGPLLPPGWDLSDPATAATIAGEIARQAGMIAYNNCFVVMTIGVLCIIPIGYLLRNPGWRRVRR